MSQAHSNQDALDSVSTPARQADVFASVLVDEDRGRISCEARDSDAPATYHATLSSDGWAVSLETSDRWLSESIESDLVHLGDSIEELIEEELADLGLDASTPKVEHYRSEDMLYTFRTPLSPDVGPDEAATWLLAYEAAFRELGDMSTEPED
jgi:hypothetical protein